MEQKIEARKKIVKVVIWVIVIFALLATVHITVNYFDIFELLKKLHGR